MAKLTIILSQHADNYIQTDTYARWGIGDLIKGVTCSFTACEEIGIRFETVTCEHPISDFYNIRPAVPGDFPNGRQFKSFAHRDAMLLYVASLKAKNENAAIMSNGYGKWPDNISKPCKTYVKELLKLNNIWKKAWENIGLDNTNYSVLHIRMGDDHLIKRRSNLPLYVRFLLFYMSTKNIFLLTDSNVVRNYAKRKYSYKMSPYEPKHLGLHTDTIEIAGTILEFNIMCSASKIYAYSSYDWISSFAMTAMKIYDVPILNLKVFSIKHHLKNFARKIKK